MERPAGLDFLPNGETPVPLDPDDTVIARVVQVFESMSNEDLARGLAEEARLWLRLNGHKTSGRSEEDGRMAKEALNNLLGNIEATVFIPPARKRSLHDLAMKFLREPVAPVEVSVHAGQVVIRVSA